MVDTCREDLIAESHDFVYLQLLLRSNIEFDQWTFSPPAVSTLPELELDFMELHKAMRDSHPLGLAR